jgi:MFS family permease
MPFKTPSTIRMLAAQIFALFGFASYPVCLKAIQSDWGLTNFESGVIASSFFFGYVCVVPFATALTDRIDARRIYLLGSFISVMGLFLFSFVQQNYVLACLLMALNGAGFAATYMPGLKIISDRVNPGSDLSRAVSFYTAFFGIGVGLSYLISGWILQNLNWQAVFALIAIGPLCSLLVVFFSIKPSSHTHLNQAISIQLSDIFPLQQWRLVLQNENSAKFILGYAFHCLELFATRNWLVAYFLFCATVNPNISIELITVVVGCINFIGVPSSIIGNEFARKWGRLPWIHTIMIGSAIAAISLCLVAGMTWWIVFFLAAIHAIFIMADSATLTAGLVLSVQEKVKGAAMGLHSLMGFGGGLIGPALFGYVLDITGGQTTQNAWLFAYIAIGLPSILYVIYNLTHLKEAKKLV